MTGILDGEPLLLPAEAAAYLGVNVKTLGRYAKTGGLDFVATGGGHRRYRRSALDAYRENAALPRHRPYPHPGAFLACHACSVAAGEPVAWEACGAK